MDRSDQSWNSWFSRRTGCVREPGWAYRNPLVVFAPVDDPTGSFGVGSETSGPPYGFQRRTARHEAGSDTRGTDADQPAPKG